MPTSVLYKMRDPITTLFLLFEVSFVSQLAAIYEVVSINFASFLNINVLFCFN